MPFARPNRIMKMFVDDITCFQNTAAGMSMICRTMQPPKSPAISEKIVSTGITSADATMRGSTRNLTGGNPIVVSASSSSSTFMVPISAANALPVRPARMIAVTSGPSSRKRPMAIRSATYTSTPNI